MRVKAQEWGNRLAVRIPKAIAEAAGVRENDELEIVVDGGVIRLVPKRPSLQLRDLLNAISPANVHDEADFGRRKGHEIW